MAGIQAHLHERRVRAGIGRVNRGKPGVDADVRDDDFQIIRRHGFADNVLHLLHQLVGEFDPRAGGGLEIDDELAGIGARKIRLADERIKTEAQNENARDAQHRRQRTQQRQIQVAFVTVEHLLELVVEPAVESSAQPLGAVVALPRGRDGL